MIMIDSLALSGPTARQLHLVVGNSLSLCQAYLYGTFEPYSNDAYVCVMARVCNSYIVYQNWCIYFLFRPAVRTQYKVSLK